jgi:hypothetical protein
MPVKRLFTFAAVGASALALSALAPASAVLNIRSGGDLHESVGQANVRDLQRGRIYRASAFPVLMRVRVPDAVWGGIQLRSGRFRFVQFTHRRRGSFPTAGAGSITLESAKGRTPSVATTVKRLHSTRLIKTGPVTLVRIAGFSGKSFDATIEGADPNNMGISLAPFTKNLHCGFCDQLGEAEDYKFAGKGQLFRIIVLGVRGKTVVIYLESVFAVSRRHPTTQSFPTFLPFAQQMLATLRFSR